MVLTLPDAFDTRRPGPPALINVGAEWCGYCSEYKPVVADLERKLAGKVRVYWVDGDASPDRVKEWNVDGFPTVLYKTSDGRLVKYPAEAPRTAHALHRFIAKFDHSAL